MKILGISLAVLLVGDLRLFAVDRQVGPGLAADERGADYMMFGYGSCEARSRGFDAC